MADGDKKEIWALGTSTLTSTEEAHFYGGGSFLRRRLISTEEAHFCGGGSFLRRRLVSTEEAHFCGGGSFLRRRLISTEEAHFYGGDQFLSNRLIFAWKTRSIAQRKGGFNQCLLYSVQQWHQWATVRSGSLCRNT